VLEAGRSVLQLGAAGSASSASSASGGPAKRRTPFAQQLDAIQGKRQLSAAQADGGVAALAAEGAAQEASAAAAAATEEAEEAARAEREALLASLTLTPYPNP